MSRKLHVRPPSMRHRLDRRRRLDALFLRRRSCDQPQSARPRGDENTRGALGGNGSADGDIGADCRIIWAQKDSKRDEGMLTELCHP
jgi:hypothetical protein